MTSIRTSLIDMACQITSKKDAVKFLQSERIIHRQRWCSAGHAMTLSIALDTWRCPIGGCRESLGMRKDTWLEGSRLPLRTFVLLIVMWGQDKMSIDYVQCELKIGPSSIVQWAYLLREACACELILNPLIIGGPGLNVEIDEFLFSKKKYNRERVFPQKWVFGGYCRETKELFMVAVPDRSRSTHESCIKEYVAAGTIIHSDSWEQYGWIDKIAGMNYTHLAVNYSKNVEDPSPGSRNKNLENTWGQAKRRNKTARGTHRRMIDGYLCEFMWRKRHCAEDPFRSILNTIRLIKPIT